jgi:hypothetical protein
MQLFEQAAQLEIERTIDDERGRLMTMPSAPSSLCSQIRVTVLLKFGSAIPGIAISN